MKFTSYISGTLFIAAFAAECFGAAYTVESPDKKIQAVVEDGAQLTFTLKADGKILLEKCPVAMKTSVGELGKDCAAASHAYSQNDTRIQTVFGIRKYVDDTYNALTLNFKNFRLDVRVYNEAAAYRFSTDFGGEIVVENEVLQLPSLKDGDKLIAHMVNGIQSSFEETWARMTVADLKLPPKNTREKSGRIGNASLPLIFEKDGLKVAIVESSRFDYPGLRISYTDADACPHAIFAPAPRKIGYGGRGKVGALERDGMYLVQETESYIAKTSGTRAFPWRGFIVARKDIDLADNDTVYKLAEPNKIGDTSWIKTGSSVWDWWVDWNIEGVDFRVGFNNETCKYYVDFAAANNIPFVTLDAGWHTGRDDRTHYNDDEAFLNGKPFVDIPAIVKYADSKGIKIVIWIYSKVMYNHPERALDLFKSWGVAGLKIDFSDRDDQWAMRHYENISRLAAERHILIDWHGCPAPAGIERTYPNCVNFEGVFGGEMNKFGAGAKVTPSHNVDLVFTRMLSGPMDYTPGGMRNTCEGERVQSRRLPCVQGTRAHMMAQYVLFYAPIQMISDMPSAYLKFPDILKFIAEAPTSWDDTKALDGKIGEYVVVARRKGDNWYVGGMCDWGGKKVSVKLSDFLPEGSYDVEVFADGVNADKAATDYKRTTVRVESSETIDVEMKKGGGFAMKIVPVKSWFNF